MSPSKPKRFQVWRPEKKVTAPVIEFRGTAHERGYDHKWSRLSDAYRRKNPFCEECQRWDAGSAQLADLVDHILPVADFPAKRLHWGNLQALCSSCHARKTLMEAHARENGQLVKLTEWVKSPELRPRQFQRPR